MNIFLTGGTGFIGSHLLNLLTTTNHNVTALRRKESRTCVELSKQPKWIDKNMDELEQSDFFAIDVLVHLASVGVSPKVASWKDLYYWNVLVMLELLENAVSVGVKRVVLAGSYAEYGRSADNFDFIPVNAPLLPTSPYAASKASGFLAANAFAVERQIELCYLRIFSAYGEGQHINNFWPSLRAAAQNGRDFEMTLGEQVRDFIPVENVAQAFLDAIENRNIYMAGAPHVANIGSGLPTKMLDFAKKNWAEWGATGQIMAGAKPYRPNEPMRYVPLISKDEI